MYLDHFGLREYPFTLTPDTSFFLASTHCQAALNTLLIAVHTGEGFIKITGEVGTGKTLLCRQFLACIEQINTEQAVAQYVTAYIPNPNLTPQGLMLSLADELGLSLAAEAEPHLVLKTITQRLLTCADRNQRVLLCFDEAQAIPLETLEALRLLTNMETEKRKLLQIVLFGQPELDVKLRQNQIRQLNQRITFHYRLGTLQRSEVEHYVRHRLHVAGYRGRPSDCGGRRPGMDDTEMSLINRMLQDLAQRQAPSNDASSRISPLGPLERKNRPLWIGLILMILVNIATLAWFLHHENVSKTAQTQTRTVVVKPVKLAITHSVTPQPSIRNPSAPVIALAEASPIKPGTPVTDAAAMAKSKPPATSGIIPAANAGIPTAPVAMASAVSREASTLPADIPPPTHPAGAQTVVSAPADGMMAIRKQAKQLTPAQLAQNEYVSALNLARQGDMQGAIDGFTRVLTLDPRHHQARLMLAGLLIESKRFNEAETLLQIGLTQDPAQIDFATLLARLQVEHDSLDASIATLMHSLPFAADQADYQAFLAALLQRSGKNDQAIDHYVIALKQNPQSGLWWMGLGISEKAAGHIAEAHEAFARAKATNSLSPDLQAFVEQQLHQP